MLYELPEPIDGQQAVTLAEATEDRPAVRVFLVPIGPGMLQSARLALAETDHPIERYAQDVQFDAFSRELCLRAIIRWEGIGRKGLPAPLDEANLRALLSDAKVLSQLQNEFVLPALVREAEKNVSAPSSAGTSPATTGAKDTALAAPSGAQRARTPSKPRKPAKAKPSGK